jgi:hypothetical protein
MQTQFNVWRVQDELHRDSRAKQLDIKLQAIRNEWEHSARSRPTMKINFQDQSTSPKARSRKTLWNCFGASFCRTRK